jgi:hypothetical protein
MRTHILIRPLLAAVLATSALAVTACGEDSAAGGEPTADQQKQAQEAQLKFARCMREHGVEMDDPKQGERGIQMVGPRGASPQKAREAEEACRKYLDAIKPPELSDEQEKQLKDAALAHARCMRDHGIDFPDPTFGEDGRATIKIERGSGVDPQDPKVQEAEKACQEKLPQIGGGPAQTEASP